LLPPADQLIPSVEDAVVAKEPADTNFVPVQTTASCVLFDTAVAKEVLPATHVIPSDEVAVFEPLPITQNILPFHAMATAAALPVATPNPGRLVHVIPSGEVAANWEKTPPDVRNCVPDHIIFLFSVVVLHVVDCNPVPVLLLVQLTPSAAAVVKLTGVL
jgi:hypothetical protein